MLPIIGARDYIEAQGYIMHSCPQCKVERVFSVYETKRKLTLYFIPTMNVRNQAVMECTSCHGRWGIPNEDKDVVALDNEAGPSGSRALLQPWMQNGEFVAQQPALGEIQQRAVTNLASLPDSMKQLTVSDPYDVRFSEGIRALRNDIEAAHTGN